MTFRYAKALHGGKLVTSGGVRNLQCAHLFVGTDHLTVRILDSRQGAVAERALGEAQYERALADASCAEHDDAVVVTLFRHHA